MFPHGSISPLGINDSKVGRTEAKYELVIKWNREKNPLISGPVNPGCGRNRSKSVEYPVGQHPSLTGCCRPAGTVRQCWLNHPTRSQISCFWATRYKEGPVNPMGLSPVLYFLCCKMSCRLRSTLCIPQLWVRLSESPGMSGGAGRSTAGSEGKSIGWIMTRYICCHLHDVQYH